MSRLAAYIVTAPGLEQVTAAEMARLDMKVVDLGVGGLTASITWSQLMLAHLHLRTATRILIRIGRFEASGFGDLQAGLRDIPFHEWLPKRSRAEPQRVVVRVATESHWCDRGAGPCRCEARL